MWRKNERRWLNALLKRGLPLSVMSSVNEAAANLWSAAGEHDSGVDGGKKGLGVDT